MSESPGRQRAGDALMLFSVVVFGSSFPFAKPLVMAMDPLLFSSTRALFSAAFLFAVLLASRRPVLLPRREWLPAIGVGLFGFTLFQGSWASALREAPPGVAAIYLATSPIWAAIFARIAGKRMAPTAWIGLVIALIGVFVVVNNDFARIVVRIDSLRPALWWLANAMGWALFVNISAPFVARVGPLRSGAWMSAVGAATLLCIALAWGGDLRAFLRFDIGLWAAFGYMALVVGGLSFLTWNLGLDRLGAPRAMLFMYLVPVAAVCIAAAVFGDPLTAPRIAGGIVVLGGVALTRAGMAKRG
ncbi:MAG: DMT family transporter [Reyranellaceae bacterium]